MKSKTVVIIGGGISGLTLAWALKSLGINYKILEQKDRPGGVIDSKIKLENTLNIGPQTFLLEPELNKLIKDLDLDNEILFPIDPNGTRAIASPKEQFHRKFSKNLLKTLLNGAFSFTDFILIMKDLLKSSVTIKEKKELKDKSIYELFATRFSKKIVEELISPALVGVWAANTSELSAKCLFPELLLAEANGSSFLKILFKKNKGKKSRIGKSKVAYLKKGLTTLTNKLADNLSKDFIYNCEIISISENEIKYKSVDLENSLAYSKIIFCCPTKSVSNILTKHKSDYTQLIELLNKIKYSPLSVVHCVIPQSDKKVERNGFGVLIPPGHSKALLGVIYSSSIFQSEYSFPDHDLLTLFIGGSVYKEFADVHDEENLNRALSDLKEILKLENDPKVLNIKYWEDGIPLYEVGHFELISKIESLIINSNIILHSNYLDGVSLPHLVRKSLKIANDLKWDLTYK